MLDYVVVGLGIAGISFCEQLEKQGKTYIVIADDSQIASKVAGGLYNPVILKRFTIAWNAKEQLEKALPFYTSLEKKLNITLDYKLPVLRRFASIEEQNLWFEASDKESLKPFLSQEIVPNKNLNIDAPFGYGQVMNTGRIDTEVLITSYTEYLLAKNNLLQKTFDHEALKISEDGIRYKSITAQQIVFAEGFGLKKNPYFNYLPLTSTKGEYVDVKAPNLKESCAIKSSIFIIPWKEDIYRVGATYKWKDITNLPTEESKEELLKKLDAFIKCDYEVVNHVAGIRPTVTDRRPLVGRHPEHANLYVLNGFGSRGVIIAPFASEQLLNYIEKDEALHKEMNISRFTS